MSYHTFTEFEPIVVIVRDDAGNAGFGEGHIAPDSRHETRAGGWEFCLERAAHIVALTLNDAKGAIARVAHTSKVAATALFTAIEMVEGYPLLQVERTARLPLLTPVNSLKPAAIREEIEQRLEAGFLTFKVKVGNDVDSDRLRVAAIQRAVAGRGTLRLDANRGYSRE